MMFKIILLFASCLWASCLAATLPMAASLTASLDLVSSSTTTVSSLSSFATYSASASNTTSPDFVPSLPTEDKTLEARYDLEAYRWELECDRGSLALCISDGDTYCDIQGKLHTTSHACADNCRCKQVYTKRPCLGNQHTFGCYSEWGSPVNFGSIDGLKKELPKFQFTQAPEIFESMHPYVLATLDTAFWSNVTDTNETDTSLQMCPDMALPSYVNYNSTLSLAANTSECIGMMEVNFNPEMPSRFLTAPGLQQDLFAMVANLGDCYLFVLGGDNATSDNMGDDDAFIIGNYDFANVMLNMVDAFAESGSIETVAACATLEGCVVENQKDGSNKTGEVGFRFCVGGSGLGAVVAKG